MRAFHRVTVLALLAAPSLLGFVSSPAPRASGVLPGELLVPPNLTSAFPACGQCHDPSPNANGRVKIQIGVRVSIDAGAKVPVTVSVLGGPNLGLGGFCIESSGGVFQPTLDTRTSATGDAITHANQFNATWTFDWQAPAAAGLVLWTAAGQSVDGDNSPSGDSWGFYGPDSAVPGVPLRLFVNAPFVTALGNGCAGSGGQEPLLGAAASATVGQVFKSEVHGAPPGAVVFCALGDSATKFGALPLPFDLGLLGAPGCAVRVNHLVVQRALAAGSGPGGGSALFAWPVPNDPTLRGLVLFFQSYVLDAGANAAGLTATNALRASMQ